MYAHAPALSLSDLLPAVRWRTAALITGGALLTAACAQIQIPLPFTPVPLTAQTFAVLAVGTTLGAWRGAASMGLYWLLGAVGLPFYAGAQGGWTVATGSTFGYLVGFVVAAFVCGYLAERGQDRKVFSAIPAMLTGTAIIYLFGVTWLAYRLQIPIFSADTTDNAVMLGMAPFVVGDAVKVVLAGLAAPAAWKLLGGRDHEPDARS